MARNAPQITVKDLTKAMQIQDQKTRSELAEKRPDSPPVKPGGPPWPGYPNPMPPGKDWLANANNIRRTNEPLGENDDKYGENPTPGHPGWQLAHGKHFGDRGEIIQDPTFGIDPKGDPVYLEHMKQTPEEQERNKGLHDWKYHDGPDPDAVKGLMIMADATGLTEHLKGIGQSQRTGSMRDSGLHKDQLIQQLLIGVEKFKAELPANNIRRLQDSGHMTVPDPDGSGRLKIIDSLGPQAQAPANNIRSTWPWRTRVKDDPRYIREFYDPVTGMGINDFKA